MFARRTGRERIAAESATLFESCFVRRKILRAPAAIVPALVFSPDSGRRAVVPDKAFPDGAQGLCGGFLSMDLKSAPAFTFGPKAERSMHESALSGALPARVFSGRPRQNAALGAQR
jgi:hypothetical protein